ncbi:unnamed protein product (macronuclear) [Paramecium tetraurelia]|uniref:PB1 domain-containing protein n=1 Tax=Paramecium tetraurelia TaxID=5888 RepID=A0C9S2_PARTE|nr:uncharacterized protein GSPATT00006846001 [Paramecium tetraurelia]CAK67539.1 unnamed protein product [Paramecium tetraurelia]|eukprot:XP_001434936.1 hypothetical protein (macronuclear) [Paramecium tetraurelia strain d4-2]
MNLQIECQGLKFNFVGVQSLEELKSRLHQAEPSFVLQSLTYRDEDDDIITLSDENDFNCLLTKSFQIVQADGQFNYQCTLNDVKQIEKEIESIKQQFEIQKKINSINNKIQFRCVIQEQMMKFHICQFVAIEEQEFTYDEENLEQFMNKIELLQRSLCEQFFESYQSMRLNKLIELKENQIRGKDNLLELSKQLNQLEQIKTQQLSYLNVKGNYNTSTQGDTKSELQNL